MKIDYLNKKTAVAIIALAFFNFIFLGVEYLYDNMMVYVTDAQGVALAESYILGASCIGFFVFPFLEKKLKSGSRHITTFAGALLGIICIFVMWQHGSYASILSAGILLFIVLGAMGSAIHYMASLVFNKRHLAKLIGIAYALGIFIQFINNNLVRNDTVESIFLATSIAIFTILMLKREDYISEIDDENRIEQEKSGNVIKNNRAAGIAIIFVVILMSCVFSTLNISVTMAHAGGEMDIGQWPRLFLAVSGLTAGLLFDVKNRKFMNIVMYCVTILSTICVVITELGGPFLLGLIVFYLSAGFFVIYFSTTFMELSYHMAMPKFWAGLGRALNNASAVLTGMLSVLLLKGNGVIIIVALILLVFISIAIYIYASQFQTDIEESEENEVNDETKFAAFCEVFSISEREQEVLSALLVSDENMQDIAVKLSISRAVLYRHIASLNNKTNTNSRIGLIQFYYTWKNGNKNFETTSGTGKVTQERF